MVQASGDVSKSRATLIARTEVARCGSILTQARCAHVGCEAYIWRTVEDDDVRHDHAILNGKVIYWNAPPIADLRSGTRAHAGQIWNCRCYPEPIIPDG
jgi:SPP1 gp7 family putative phage head morphogenesis protein